MNTPLFAKHPIHDSAKVKIAPVHSDFGVATLRFWMGFAGRRLNWNSALEVLRFLQCPPSLPLSSMQPAKTLFIRGGWV